MTLSDPMDAVCIAECGNCGRYVEMDLITDNGCVCCEGASSHVPS